MSMNVNRRRFLKAADTSAASLTILQATSARTYAANEKLNIACIGAGGRAGSNIRAVESQNIVALCDVDWHKAIPRAIRERDPDAAAGAMQQHMQAVLDRLARET
jgi:DNA-binding FadR family transcriptional regulator